MRSRGQDIDLFPKDKNRETEVIATSVSLQDHVVASICPLAAQKLKPLGSLLPWDTSTRYWNILTSAPSRHVVKLLVIELLFLLVLFFFHNCNV